MKVAMERRLNVHFLAELMGSRWANYIRHAPPEQIRPLALGKVSPRPSCLSPSSSLIPFSRSILLKHVPSSLSEVVPVNRPFVMHSCPFVVAGSHWASKEGKQEGVGKFCTVCQKSELGGEHDVHPNPAEDIWLFMLS